MKFALHLYKCGAFIVERVFMVKLLVVDDEEKIRAIISKYAKHEGYEVIEAADGREALEKVADNTFDLIVLDVMMPGDDGFTVCAAIRKKCNTPVIMLSARGEVYDRIRGLEAGADDYVVKPFSPMELMLRIKAVISRSRTEAVTDEHKIFTYESLYVDITARVVKIDGRVINMTPKEYDLFFYFVENRGIALSREKLITQVWGYDYYGDDRTLDTHIKLLRGSLGKYRNLLTTLRGVGYRFEAQK